MAKQQLLFFHLEALFFLPQQLDKIEALLKGEDSNIYSYIHMAYKE